jgi:hypothetical protein
MQKVSRQTPETCSQYTIQDCVTERGKKVKKIQFGFVKLRKFTRKTFWIARKQFYSKGYLMRPQMDKVKLTHGLWRLLSTSHKFLVMCKCSGGGGGGGKGTFCQIT